jgi:hypothetical protein
MTMPLFLAQLTPPDGLQLLIWLACAGSVLGALAFLLMLFNQAAKARKTIRGERDGVDLQQPLEVTAHQEMSREKDCRDRFDTAMAHIQEMKAQRERDIASNSATRKAIYEEIKARNDSTWHHIDGVRKELSDKIESVPDRVIATLRNFGAIGKQQ